MCLILSSILFVVFNMSNIEYKKLVNSDEEEVLLNKPKIKTKIVTPYKKISYNKLFSTDDLDNHTCCYCYYIYLVKFNKYMYPTEYENYLKCKNLTETINYSNSSS